MKRLKELPRILQKLYAGLRHLMVDVGLQLLIRGSGLLIFKLFLASNSKKVDVDSPQVLLSGIVFWGVLLSAPVLLLR